MNMKRKLNPEYPIDEASTSPKVTLKLINGKKEEKLLSIDYLNEKLAYFYNNGGPVMDI